jgi:RNA polymerase sigma factor (sigma-70 family)
MTLLGPSPSMEDVLQETWTTALARPPAQQGSLRPWLRTVLQNLVRLQARGDSRRQTREREADVIPEPLPSADELLSRHQSLTLLAQMVAALDEPYRSTVLLCYGEELSPSEVARRQGIPSGTVRWRLKQGLDRLRSEMDRAHGGRRAWAGLAPVVVSSSALVTGGMLFMNAKVKIAAGAAVIALLAGLAAWWRLGGPPPSAPSQTAGPSGAELRRLAEQPPDQQWASVAGRVIDEQGQAVRATVALAGNDDRVGPRRRPGNVVMTAAGPDGRFAASRVAPGRYRLVAAAPGYLPASRPDIVLAAGDRQEGVELVLRKGGYTLTGRVLDSGGGSIGGARVRVAVDAAGMDPAMALPMAVADAAGSFQVTLPRGRHGFVVEADGYAPSTALVPLIGDQTRDFRLNAAGQLSGRVVRRGSPEGEAGAFVRLECTWQGQPSMAETVSGEDGSFLLDNVEPGDCALVASKGELGGRIAGGLVVEVAGRVSGLVVPLERGRSVAGVVVRGGQPVAGVHVRLTENADDRASGYGGFSRWRAEMLTGGDGRFQLQGVLGGSYQLQAIGRGIVGSTVALTIADRDIEGVRLEALPSATVNGLVTDATGNAVAGAVVTGQVHSLDRLGIMHGTGPVRSGSDGRFVLDSAGPGALTVTVDHPTLGLAEGGLERIEAGESRELTIRLGAKRMVTIHGQVRWEGSSPGRPGKPAPGLLVNGMVFRGNSARTTTGSDGRFVLGPFAPGTTVLVGVQHMPWTMEESPATTHTVKLEDADARDVEILVPAADGVIRGSVLGPDGHPVSGVLILTQPGRADASVITGSDGSFVVDGLSRGTYLLRAEHPGLPAVERPDVRTGERPIVLQIPSGGRLEGIVTREGGSGAPCAVWAVPITPGPMRTDQGVGRGMVRQWVSATDGSFALGPLAPGSYNLYAVSPEGLVGHLPAVPLSGASRKGLQIELRAGATLDGRVLDFLSQQPVAGARLRASPLGRTLTATSGSDGSFQLRGLVPGAATRVEIEAPGYNSLQRTVVTPPDGRTERRQFALVTEERGRKSKQKGAIGLVVAQDERDRVVVRTAPPGLPAANAGLSAGDAILSIDGLDVTEIGVGGVVTLLRGDPGTPLVLRFLKPDGVVKEVRLVRV